MWPIPQVLCLERRSVSDLNWGRNRLRVAAQTGLRLSELIGLDGASIHLGTGVHVRCVNVLRMHGCGGRRDQTAIARLKTFCCVKTTPSVWAAFRRDRGPFVPETTQFASGSLGLRDAALPHVP
jgi:hypothetical protein